MSTAEGVVTVAAGVTPSPSMLESDYTAAGQTSGSDITNPRALWTYWRNSGIDGLYLYSEIVISKGAASLENAVKAHRAVIAEDSTPGSAFIGLTKYGAGTGIMIADGYTPKGPLVVFQGKTIQMTWAQWGAQIRSVWELVVNTTPPTVTPPTPPTSTTAPSSKLSLSSNNVTSAGGTVTLTYSSENATACTLTSSPSIWTTATEPVNCNGTYQFSVVSATTAKEWTFTFTASDAESQSAVSTQTLVQSAPTAPTPQFDNPSPNWSGYVVPSSSALVTDVEGEWTVPIMNCGETSNGDTSTWVGIGGEQWNTTSSSGVLLQTGVETECVDGAQQNYGWWEMYPAVPNVEEIFTNFPVSAGDNIESSVSELSDGSWETTVSDLTTGLSGYMITGEAWGVSETGASSFTDQGRTTGLSYSGGYTAEWIVEDPGVANEVGTYQPFGDFGSITFGSMRSSFTAWYLTPSEEWGIVQGGVTLAAPTSSATDGFTDTYTGPTNGEG